MEITSQNIRLRASQNGHSPAGYCATCLDPLARRPYAVGMANAKNKKSRRKAILLGVGLDSDGHKRVTTGPNFALLGGSQETHEVMTEKVIKINEKLAAKGKQLENVSREEFDDIADSVGLQRPK
jgi:hypothetical protein